MAVIANTDQRGLTNPAAEWVWSVHRAQWWNSYKSRWDAILPMAVPPAATQSDWWIVKDIPGTQTAALFTGAPKADHPDVIWDDANKTLYVLWVAAAATRFSSFTYNDATDTYTVSVNRVTVPGIAVEGGYESTALGRSPNGHLWVAANSVASDTPANRFLVNKSTNGGATWGAAAVQLQATADGGKADISSFTDGGTTYVLAICSENGGAPANRQKYAFRIGQDDTGWGTAGNWTNETSNLPPYGAGLYSSDDEISVARDSSGNIYVIHETENISGSGNPQWILWKRTPAGVWSETVITLWTETPYHKRPSVTIDETNQAIYCFAGLAQQVGIVYRTAPLSSLGDLATASDNYAFSGTYYNVHVPETITSDSGLLAIATAYGGQYAEYFYLPISGGGGPTQTGVARVSLASASTPETKTNHKIHVRARVTGGSGTIRAALYEGATNRSGDLESAALTGTLAEYTIPIGDTQAAAITDYSNLEIRFWGYSDTGDAATFEIDQVWLSTPAAASGPTTWYGATSSSFSVGFTTSGLRKTFGVTATAFSASYVTSGKRKTFGASVSAFSAGYTTSGRRKAFGAVSSPFTASYVTSGRRKAFGASVSVFSASYTTSGTRKTFGVSTSAFSAGFTTAGERKFYGASATSLSAGFTTAGRRTTRSATILNLSAGFTTAASRKTFGSVVLPLTTTYVTTGDRWSGAQTYYGATSTVFSVGYVTSGTRKTFGAVVFPFTLGVTTAGRRTTKGQVVFSASATYVTNAVRKTFSASISTFSVGYTTAGSRKVYGAVVVPLSIGYVTNGTKTTGPVTWQGASVSNFSVGFVTNARKTTWGAVVLPFSAGYVVSGRRKVYGATATALTAGYVVSGQRKAFGAVVTPFTVGYVTSGRRKIYGAIVVPFTAGYVISGQRKTFGATVSAFTFGYVTSGQKKTFGSIVTPYTATYVVSGRKTTRGAVVLPLTVSYVSSGDRWVTARNLYGSVVFPLTVGITTQGKPEKFAQVVLPFTSSYVTRATRRTTSSVVASFSVGYITAAKRRTFSRSSVPFTVSYVVSGYEWRGIPVFLHEPFARPTPLTNGFKTPDPENQELTVPSPHSVSQ